MPLSELLSAVNQLSHQDKLRLIHFLLLAVAKEEGFELEPANHQTQEGLLNQLWSDECASVACRRELIAHSFPANFSSNACHTSKKLL